MPTTISYITLHVEKQQAKCDNITRSRESQKARRRQQSLRPDPNLTRPVPDPARFFRLKTSLMISRPYVRLQDKLHSPYH